MDIGLNWNEWHQEAARKPYVRVGVTLLSGALILMSAQEIVSLYLEKNLISEIEVCYLDNICLINICPDSFC